MKYSIQYLLADNYRYLETRSLTRWQDPGWGRVLEPTVTSSQSWLWPTLRKSVPPSYYKRTVLYTLCSSVREYLSARIYVVISKKLFFKNSLNRTQTVSGCDKNHSKARGTQVAILDRKVMEGSACVHTYFIINIIVLAYEE